MSTVLDEPIDSILVLYGSQTGNAEAIGKDVYRKLATINPAGLSVECLSMNAYVNSDLDLSRLSEYDLLVCVLSTTGQGDPPDSAHKFLRAFKKLPSTALATVRSAVLALGDTNYADFAKPATALDTMLTTKSATRLIPLAKADDAVGLELTVDPWTDKLISAVRAKLRPQHSNAQLPPLSSPTRSSAVISSATATKNVDDVKPLFTPSATASAIVQAQAAMRALALARANKQPTPSAPIPVTAIPSLSLTSAPSHSLSLSFAPSIILFGTQTGNSEGVANEIHSLWSERFAGCTCMSMAAFTHAHANITDLSIFKLIFIVISTTGQGDPPDMAHKFLRQIKQQNAKSIDWLKGVKYAVLGLGDTNYDSFGAVPTRVDKDLAKAGAVQFMKREVADDAVGLSVVIDPFKVKLMKALDKMDSEMKANKPQTTILETAPSVVTSMHATSLMPVASKHFVDESKSTPSSAVASSSIVVSSRADSDERKVDDEAKNGDFDPLIKRPHVDCEKPFGLPRFQKTHVLIKTNRPTNSTLKSARSDLDQYFSRRWSRIDVQAVLKGYTPDAPFMARLSCAEYLTTAKSHAKGRRVVHLELELPTSGVDSVMYAPGDSVGVYCPNSVALVERLCRRLNLDSNSEVEIKVDNTTNAITDTSKTADANNAQPTGGTDGMGLPHIASPCTIRSLFVFCVDITTPPRKSALRMLAEFCHETNDKRALYHLASAAGQTEYDKEILGARPTLLDLLQRYPSSQPPLTYLLEHLPALQPRYYSITSSPLMFPCHLHIAYTVVDDGVCTSWMTSVAQSVNLLPTDDQYKPRSDDPICGVQMSNETFSLPVFLRRSTTFTLPTDLKLPMILIGPGTGVAPFRSFLQHRRQQRNALLCGGAAMGEWHGLEVDEEEYELEDEQTEAEQRSKAGFITRQWNVTRKKATGKYEAKRLQLVQDKIRSVRSEKEYYHLSESSASAPAPDSFGAVHLYFGCRAPDEDYLYEKNFNEFLTSNTLSTMKVAFSRVDDLDKVYVQHQITQDGEMLWDAINHGAMIFVCGDGNAMAKAVQVAVQSLFVRHGNMIDEEASKAIANMIKDKRYVQEVWS